MKFLLKEYKSFKKLLESKHFRMNDFAFVKRKGNLYIQFKDSELQFVMHRDTETLLDENNQWTKQNTYQIYHPVIMKDIKSWDEVLVEFEKWLFKLKPGG